MEQKEIIQLVRASQEGDRRALEQLVAAVQDRVLFHCVRMIPSRADAEDAAQDILIAMIRGLGTMRSPESFWPWLHQIVVNTCRHQARSRKQTLLRQRKAETDLMNSLEELDRARQPENLLESEEKRRIIMSLIDGLPEPQRLCEIGRASCRERV